MNKIKGDTTSSPLLYIKTTSPVSMKKVLWKAKADEVDSKGSWISAWWD